MSKFVLRHNHMCFRPSWRSFFAKHRNSCAKSKCMCTRQVDDNDMHLRIIHVRNSREEKCACLMTSVSGCPSANCLNPAKECIPQRHTSEMTCDMDAMSNCVDEIIWIDSTTWFFRNFFFDGKIRMDFQGFFWRKNWYDSVTLSWRNARLCWRNPFYQVPYAETGMDQMALIKAVHTKNIRPPISRSCPAVRLRFHLSVWPLDLPEASYNAPDRSEFSRYDSVAVCRL